MKVARFSQNFGPSHDGDARVVLFKPSPVMANQQAFHRNVLARVDGTNDLQVLAQLAILHGLKRLSCFGALELKNDEFFLSARIAEKHEIGLQLDLVASNRPFAQTLVGFVLLHHQSLDRLVGSQAFPSRPQQPRESFDQPL